MLYEFLTLCDCSVPILPMSPFTKLNFNKLNVSCVDMLLLEMAATITLDTCLICFNKAQIYKTTQVPTNNITYGIFSFFPLIFFSVTLKYSPTLLWLNSFLSKDERSLNKFSYQEQ